MYFDMKGVMVRFPYVAGFDMSLSQAETYMKECKIRHLPLIENNEVRGLISERDILKYKGQSNYSKLSIRDVVGRPPFVVTEQEPLSNVLEIMRTNKFGSALIVNQDSQLVGIFTTTDALVLLQNLIAGDPKLYKKPGEVVFVKDVVAWN